MVPPEIKFRLSPGCAFPVAHNIRYPFKPDGYGGPWGKRDPSQGGK